MPGTLKNYLSHNVLKLDPCLKVIHSILPRIVTRASPLSGTETQLFKRVEIPIEEKYRQWGKGEKLGKVGPGESRAEPVWWHGAAAE